MVCFWSELLCSGEPSVYRPFVGKGGYPTEGLQALVYDDKREWAEFRDIPYLPTGNTSSHYVLFKLDALGGEDTLAFVR